MAANPAEEVAMGAFGRVAKDSIEKKKDLFENHFWKYAMRSLLATLFLALGTGTGVQAGEIGNMIAPGLGKFLFSFIFSFSLVLITYMNVELATANMMFMTIGARNHYLSWQEAAKILFTCILFNLIGGFIFAWLISQTAIYQDLPADHLLFTTVAGKLAKSPWTAFWEGIIANVAVTTAIVASNRMQNADGRVLAIILTIFNFAFLGAEHLIANFVLFPLVFFVNGGPIPGMTIGSILTNYVFAFLGNYVGGGLLIGWVYAWLSRDERMYMD